MLFDQRADIWRELPDPANVSRTLRQAWRRGVMCHLEPISSIDHTVAYALESTHVLYLPVWFAGLRKEDEIRLSGRIDNLGARVPNRYIVAGIRRFVTFGDRHLAVYCKERE